MTNPRDHLTADRPATRGNGHVERPDGLVSRPGRPPGPSARPAALVFGIIFVLFVVGAVAAGLTGSSATHAPRAPSPAVVPGTGGLVAVPARSALVPLLGAGEPPADVVAALVVPRGSQSVPGSATQRGVGLFDGAERVQVAAAEGPATTFFRTELVAGRWHILRYGPTAGGYQFLALHPGSDGYEWELGLTLSPTQFVSAVPGVTAPPSGDTPVSVRLFAVPDQS